MHTPDQSILSDGTWGQLTQLSSALSRQDCEVLMREARGCGDGLVVELGSFRGRGVAALALAVRRVVYTVDHFAPWETPRGERAESSLEAFRHGIRLLRLDALVKPIVASSTEPPRTHSDIFHLGSVALLFVDADHRKEAVIADVERWAPTLRSGARILLHDWALDWTGVHEAALQLQSDGVIEIEELVHSDCGMLVARYVGSSD